MRSLLILTSLHLFGFAPNLIRLVAAHGDDGMEGHMGGHDAGGAMMEEQPEPETEYLPNYFSHPDHVALIYAHIALMVVSWVFVLPTAVMFSLARSRYTLRSQLAFLVLNALGLGTGVIYNAKTPDLYPNNAHNSLGWVVTLMVVAQVALGVLSKAVAAHTKSRARYGALPTDDSSHSFISPTSSGRDGFEDAGFPAVYRLSTDSGQGTERNTASLRSNSVSSSTGDLPADLEHAHKEYGHGADESISLPIPAASHTLNSVGQKVVRRIPFAVGRAFQLVYHIIDRTILLLGFVALCTGVTTFARFFEGHEIFSGLAHWIKGGVFFWFGIYTLGRWAGSFGDIGWAWNVRPLGVRQKWRPSAEFVESALIFFYGSTNIFLEHLGGAGGPWTATDLEHLSITVLFIGGGLCGMLVESTRIRDLLNTTVTMSVSEDMERGDENANANEPSQLEIPRHYGFSLNPIPALVVLLLGIMMSSHTQHSMIAGMVHKQWGNLLTAAAFSRALTYVMMFLKPPRSVYPSRPPTELLTSFGLISGGIIFMASSNDTIKAMIHYELDAMFMYTVTMGLVGILMAWVIILLAIKGHAVRKEASLRAVL